MSVAPVQPTPFVPIQALELPKQSLYGRIGGMVMIRQVVDDLCMRAMGDAKLRNWVRETAPDPARLGAYKRMFTEFLAGLTGGPAGASGENFSSAHRGLGINAVDFDRFFVYFIQSVYEVDMQQSARSELLAAFALTKEDVVENW